MRLSSSALMSGDMLPTLGGLVVSTVGADFSGDWLSGSSAPEPAASAVWLHTLQPLAAAGQTNRQPYLLWLPVSWP